MSNGPATAAPSVISIAMTTPPALVRIHDPAEAAQRDRPIGVAGMLQAVHRLQHPLEHQPHVVVGPGAGSRVDAVNRFVRGEVVALAARRRRERS